MSVEGAPMSGGSGSTGFTWEELTALLDLRERRRRGVELFTDRQLAYLSFIRWLYGTGRLASDTPFTGAPPMDARWFSENPAQS